MTAAVSDRNTPRREGDERVGLLAASQAVFLGTILMRNAAGNLLKGATAVGSVGVGVSIEAVTSGASAGVQPIRYRPGIHRFMNSASTDLITRAEIGQPAYVVDDQTVAKTSATDTRSPAGVIEDVDALGVWIRFDEALTRAVLS
ncbi:hypothetical protein [Paracoccus sp. IB05]|uniref:hypothetical protein n=1 Tax=Paracoccus sp. IB05 TaxID=2779367 RepID=UPI0018E8F389|nr:hypothetical protein [Paracoccus sp. IB05]MBJ2150611.1 hypothetical protein [Paracoccus sp. IB05]